MTDRQRQRAAGRRANPQAWPVRRGPVEREPLIDPRDPTTIDERLAQVWPLTVEMWALARKEIPSYARHEAPGKLTRRKVR